MYDVTIIGAGPAGASAALFCAKAGKRTALFDNGKSITSKAWVKNHYGIKSVDGPDLLQTGQQQAKAFGAELFNEEVEEITTNGQSYTVKNEQTSIETKHIIFATGMSVKTAQQFGVEIAEGTEPRVAKIIQVNEQGQTSMNRVWAAGTVAGESVHTIITAGHGAKVAVNVLSEIDGKRYVDHDILK